jgi:hypothetical protein
VTRFDHAIPETAKLPAEIFAEAGFRTAGIWRNGWVAPNFGFGQGFETYVRPVATNTAGRFERRAPSVTPIFGTDEDATRAAISFLESYGRERFFLYVHYMDVHQYAYDQRAADLARIVVSDGYDSAIHWVDRNVAALLRGLRDLGLAERTLIVIASDHGEAFMEHGSEGHARNLYREVTHVPLILALPFELERGLVVEPQVRNVDVWPTVLELVGLPPLPERRPLAVTLIRPRRRPPGPPGPPSFSSGALGGLSRQLTGARGGRSRSARRQQDSSGERSRGRSSRARASPLSGLGSATPVPCGLARCGSTFSGRQRRSPLMREQLRALGYVDH